MTTSKQLVAGRGRFSDLEQGTWWPQLSHTDQVLVRKEAQALGEELIRLGQSRLVIGRCLKRIHDVLEPKRLFGRFLEEHFIFRRVTAYRYMKHFKDQGEIAPPQVLKVAMAHGIDRITPKMLKGLPETDDHQEILTHLLNAHRRADGRGQHLPRRAVVVVAPDPHVLMREAENFARSRLQRMSDRQRRERTLQLCAILLGDAGFTKLTAIKPISKPEEIPGNVSLGRLRTSA